MTAHAATPDDTVVNAMSIDVEDYFQVSAFDQRVAGELSAPRAGADFLLVPLPSTPPTAREQVLR